MDKGPFELKLKAKSKPNLDLKKKIKNFGFLLISGATAILSVWMFPSPLSTIQYILVSWFHLKKKNCLRSMRLFMPFLVTDGKISPCLQSSKFSDLYLEL